ncbi:MAG: hypothetical protein WCB12_14085 [Bryobacteraceae bacterium]
MARDRVIIVHLRRPTAEPSEKRSDPFWEFGSFGITGCHSKNLMNPKNADKLRGVRLAFAQGGTQGTRLVHLTPPVKIVEHRDRIEAVWTPPQMPFRYGNAPVLVSNTGRSQFPQFADSIKAGGRTTVEGQFAANFRSRTDCITDGLAHELIRVWARKRKEAQRSETAGFYEEALPWPPALVDRNREQTYTQHLNEAGGSKPRSGCGSRKRPGSRSPAKGRRRPCASEKF